MQSHDQVPVSQRAILLIEISKILKKYIKREEKNIFEFILTPEYKIKSMMELFCPLGRRWLASILLLFGV